MFSKLNDDKIYTLNESVLLLLLLLLLIIIIIILFSFYIAFSPYRT